MRRTNRSLILANECNFRRIRAAPRELIGNAPWSMSKARIQSLLWCFELIARGPQ
jgi:hypothetical protein